MVTTALLLQVGFLPFSQAFSTRTFIYKASLVWGACPCSSAIQQELSHLSDNKISRVALFLPNKSFPQPAEAENAAGEWCVCGWC